MRNLSDEQWQVLADGMARELARIAPDWTEHNSHDPGITVLEVLAYTLNDLRFRAEPLDTSGRALARRVAQLAESLAVGTATDDCPPGLQRLNYFSGRLLSADDFTAEQNYFREKARRHNRMLHGWGVVSGLGVTLESSGSGAQVVVAPGLAIDKRGEEIEVCAPAMLPLPAQGTALLVLLHYAEQPCCPVEAPLVEAEAQTFFSRLTETFSATLAPTADDTALALARLNFSQGQWLLDREFSVVRVRV